MHNYELDSADFIDLVFTNPEAINGSVTTPTGQSYEWSPKMLLRFPNQTNQFMTVDMKRPMTAVSEANPPMILMYAHSGGGILTPLPYFTRTVNTLISARYNSRDEAIYAPTCILGIIYELRTYTFNGEGGIIDGREWTTSSKDGDGRFNSCSLWRPLMLHYLKTNRELLKYAIDMYTDFILLSDNVLEHTKENLFVEFGF